LVIPPAGGDAVSCCEFRFLTHQARPEFEMANGTNNPAQPLSATPEAFLSGGGELGQLLRDFDWTSSPLGPPRDWPQSLKTAVRIMLTSRQPIWVGWGKQLIYLYNDAYKSIIGGKHPWALGRPTQEVWREIWNDIDAMLRTAMAGDEGTYVESQLLIMERFGYPEETYYTFSYSPIPDGDHGTGGIICANTDDTRRVIGERQLALLRNLAASAADARTWQDATARSASAMESNPYDLPFALIYIRDPDGATMSLAGTAGMEAGHPLAPQQIDPQRQTRWPIREALEAHDIRVFEDFQSPPDAPQPSGAWQRPPSTVAVVPIASMGHTGRGGVLIAGLNPFRQFDESYRNFINLVAGQISASIAHAEAYEEERKRAESLAELDRAKTTFFSNVSHEFRTPLTLMLGPLQDALAQSHAMPPAVAEDLSIVQRNGMRLLKLVNTLLDFSRIEAGRVQAVYAPTDLPRFTADLASVFRSAIERAGMRLRVDCPDMNEPVYVDRGMWEKIVLNLLSNAFKFTLDGEIVVALRPQGDHVLLTVRDTGIGIPEHELPRLFERFHRVEGTKGRTHEGTGIGLALVQELVKLHGGNVEVQSGSEQGSTFAVRIPRGSAHLPADRINGDRSRVSTSLGADVFVEEARRWLPDGAAEQTEVYGAEALPQTAPASDGQRARIVLADDNADMRQYVQRLLSPLYDVEVVGDGAAALQAVKTRRTDLLISDVMMPRLDGFGLLKALRDDQETAPLPVILLSARAGEEATLEGLQAGADDYLVKPFSARELLGRVAALLERTRYQQELAAVDARLRMALRSARMVAWELDVEQGTVVLSDTAADVFGLTPGTKFDAASQGNALLHPDDREAHGQRIQTAIRALTSFHSQFRLIRPIDGKTAWMEERGVAQRDPLSGKVRVVGVVMDVTEAKRAEQEREQLLEREREARGHAEHASRLKEDFLATLSHELRTPLTAIFGWAQLLEQGNRDPAALSEGLAAISRNARAQTQLIEDLLDMSRIASGKLRLEVQRIDLSDVVSAAVESVRPAAEARNIRLARVLDSSRTVVSGDPHRLQQVVWNLLSNAIKFTPKGGRVQVVLQRINSHAELSIIDNGQGIAPSFLPHVFERFRQADASTTRGAGGLGLGLSIVKQLVELHGGTVAAHSAGEGKGATFTVALPLAVTHLAAPAPPQGLSEPPAGETLADVTLEGVTVLVVDDEPDTRSMIQRTLESCKATVLLAQSSEEAVQRVRRDRPDVIVSDIGMPGQDGYALMRAVRSLPPEQGGETPAAALTAYARAQDRRQALFAGYQSHVVKPADPAELVTVVASLAGRLGRFATA
jgi:PAS domain S-box-containing protein